MRRFFLVVSAVLLVIYGATGIYEVEPEESGVEYMFGRIVNPQVASGIHWNFPAPIGRQVVAPTRLNQVLKVGFSDSAITPGNLAARQDLWFTGGASVVECRLEIQYSIAKLDQFLLSHDDPEEYMRVAAERAATRFLAGLHVDEILTTSRQAMVSDVSSALQQAMDEAALGIKVQDVSIAHLAPPLPGGVSDAFREVQSARSERERDIENAKSDAARKVFEAQAEAETLTSRSQGDRFARISQAKAAADRFAGLARERRLAPGVTETRIYRDVVPKALESAKLYVVPTGGDTVAVE